MSRNLILAIDQGTSSSRAIVYGPGWETVGIGQAALELSTPRPGWVECDPEVIWGTQLAAARNALVTGRVPAGDIAAIGITNQRETTILWNRVTGAPLGPAIVWQDRRTAARCQQLKELGKEPWLTEKTGLVADPYFSATKIRWILEQVGGINPNEIAFGTVDSWLIWQLTKGRVHATDRTNASRTLLMNLETGDWDEELLAEFGVPREILPEIRPSIGSFGATSADVIGAEIPIFGVAGDQQAALRGQGCVESGQCKATYGTGTFILVSTGQDRPRSRNGLLGTAAAHDGSFALEGSVFNSGSVIQWLRDGLGIISNSAEVEALGSTAPDTGDLWLVPAFSGLGTPDWDPGARGVLVGITRGTTRSHIARAALEAIAHQTCEIVDAMESDTGLKLRVLRVDGGASSNDLLMQIQADLLGIPVERPTHVEATALGAALLASEGAELGLSDPEPDTMPFEPLMDQAERAERKGRWREAVERSKAWAT